MEVMSLVTPSNNEDGFMNDTERRCRKILAQESGEEGILVAGVVPSSVAVAAMQRVARIVAEPFVVSFRKHGVRYERAGSKWFTEMPGSWPIQIEVTMTDCREADAFLGGGLRANGDETMCRD